MHVECGGGAWGLKRPATLLGADFCENACYKLRPAGMFARLPYAVDEFHALISGPEAATDRVKGVEGADSVISSAMRVDLPFMDPIQGFRKLAEIRGRRLFEINGYMDVLNTLRLHDFPLMGNGVLTCVRKQVNENFITFRPKCPQRIRTHDPGCGQLFGNSAKVVARFDVHILLRFYEAQRRADRKVLRNDRQLPLGIEEVLQVERPVPVARSVVGTYGPALGWLVTVYIPLYRLFSKNLF